MSWARHVPVWCWWALVLLVCAGGQQIRVSGAQADAAEVRRELADQTLAYQREREAGALAVIDWQEAEQVRRRGLEDRLQANDETHYKELLDGQKTQARLRDRLATADLRLSVLLAATTTQGSGSGVPATTGAGGVVHGAARGELDPAAAQRIVAIAGDADQGLIALTACQAYVHEVASRSPPILPAENKSGE